MTAADLYSECGKCGGSGEYAPPPVRTSGMSMTFVSSGSCPDCKGVGAIPTDEGRAILQLVKRFSRLGRIEIPE